MLALSRSVFYRQQHIFEPDRPFAVSFISAGEIAACNAPARCLRGSFTAI
jgi:hypothetical protein